MSLYLGLDSSTQSLSAIVIDVQGDRRQVVFDATIPFDEELPQYGTRHGVLPDPDPSIAVSSPIMWAEALDRMIARLARSGLDTGNIAAVSGSAQQHGSVYLNHAADARLAALDPRSGIAPQVAPMLSRPVAPIWMDSSTSLECREIASALGGDRVLAVRTGSRAFERFAGPQIRKFAKADPAGYEKTAHIHLVSSFLASLLAGGHAPLDPGDGSGMNLMDLATAAWWPEALDATAPGLRARLPAIVPASSIVGRLSRYWRERHGLPPAKVVAWSGDNPCSLIGTGLVREGRVALSLGTSDTIFGLMGQPHVDPGGIGHVFGAPTGAYMGITVFRNGSLARERIRDAFGMTWPGFSHALSSTPPGNGGRMLLPWFEPEITPPVAGGAVHRQGLALDDGPGHVRAVVEAQMMAMALHSRWMGVDIRTIHATGGAAANREILQVAADVFGAEVYRFAVSNSACLGAALRAWHGDALSEGREVPWEEVVAGLAEPVSGSRVRPDVARHALYQDVMKTYSAFEATHRAPSSKSTTS